MTVENTDGFAEILGAAGNGDREAIGRLYALLYPQLREYAHRRIRSMPNVTLLDTTSLVNESYLKLIKAGKVAAADRKHFLAYAAHVMRSVVVDYVRQAKSLRRGGDDVHVTLNTNALESLASSADEVVRLDALLQELSTIDERLVRVVEMRYFACLDADVIGDCLGVSARTINRDLEKIRLLLIDERA
jgi:RNA polymerase sigma factor (TIGR02999 family)